MKAALIFLNAEKVFDNLNWTFMLKVWDNKDLGRILFKG